MLAVVFALVSAAMSAFAAAGEQRAAAHAGDHGGRARRHAGAGRAGAVAGFLLGLVTSPLWLGSWAVDAGSFFAQAAALDTGPVSLVQPLMVTTLLFTLPLSAWGHRYWPRTGDWAGAGLICLGLALMLSTRHLQSTQDAPTGALPAALGVVGLGVVILVLAAGGKRPAVRAPLLSVAAGALFAVGAALTKLTAHTLTSSGLLAVLTSWSGYALAVVSIASFALQQVAYASGSLATAVTAAVITDPLVSYLLGVLGYGEAPPTPGWPLTVTMLGVSALACGIALLARSPLLAAPRQPELPPHTLARTQLARMNG